MKFGYGCYLSGLSQGDWFSSFEKLDGSMELMGDDHTCRMEGIGTILIKMFDGVVRELKSVRYVPQLKT